MKNPDFITENYYHIYNRGVEKRKIFLDSSDYFRFLETLDFYRKSPQPIKLSDYRRGPIKFKETKNKIDLVDIHCFCLMPNHFHFLIQQSFDNGITNFLKKITNSYTRYFNTKYDRIGPLFQGSFKAKYIKSDEYLLQLSKYIHRNPFPLDRWEGEIYPYSSYSTYISGKKHIFCNTNFILSYFSRSNPNVDYKTFVEESNGVDSGLTESFIDSNDCTPT